MHSEWPVSECLQMLSTSRSPSACAHSFDGPKLHDLIRDLVAAAAAEAQEAASLREQMASLREQIEVWGELADRLTDGGKPRKKEELLRDVEWITSLVQAREIIADSHGDVMGNLAQCIISERIATESVMMYSIQAMEQQISI